jgi:tetratricopeptide (TPR) repeat protein
LAIIRRNWGGNMNRRIIFSLAALLLMPAVFIHSQTLLLEPPLVHPDTPEKKASILRLAEDMVFAFTRLYGGKGPELRLRSGETGKAGPAAAPGKPPREEILLTLSAVEDGTNRVISLNMTREGDGKSAEPFTYLGEWTGNLGPYFARAAYYLLAALDDFTGFSPGSPPEYIDEFHASSVRPASLPVPGLQLYPYSLAVKKNGNLLVGANSLSLEMDRDFRIIGFPGKSLLEEGNYTYAFGVAATPADTLYFRPAAGGDMYTLLPGTERPRRVRTAVSGAGPFAILPDGSQVLVDTAQRRAYRLDGRSRTELPLFPGQYSYITAIAADPEGNLWVADAMDKHLIIYSPSGVPVDSVLPLAPSGVLSGTKALAVFSDGSFLLLSQTALLKFRRDGTPVWRLDALPSPGGPSGFATVMGMAADSGTGYIYLADYTGRRIVKLQDPSQSGAKEAELGLPMRSLGRRLLSDPDDIEALEARAEYYEKAGAFDAAFGAWERVLEADPFHPRGEERLRKLETETLRAAAGELKTKTLELLRDLGPESARGTYSRAVQMFEKILGSDPEDRASAGDLEELKRAFSLREGGREKKRPPLRFTSTSLENLFPALMRKYQDHPVGKITLVNPLDEPVTDLRVEVFINAYMDFPSPARGPDRLGPGETAAFDLTVHFNQSILSLEEDLPVQAGITAAYREGGEEYRVTANKTVTLYRKSALTWEDTAKLAAFITPNESTVASFALRGAGGTEASQVLRFGGPFARAMTIYDTLGAYGINYVEDPQSPFAGKTSDRKAIDTVRFPRTTLYYKSGDCDDTTALLASLFEAAGIQTAIMTSPGHVFLAFDTGEPRSNLRFFQAEGLEAMADEGTGTLWLPLESTDPGAGFFEAWKRASRLVREHRPADGIEFLPVSEAWKTYPPLPLPERVLPIIEPAPGRTAEVSGRTSSNLERALYAEPAARLAAELAALDTAARPADAAKRAGLLNRIGILHARFGRLEQAEKALTRGLRENPGSAALAVNYGNLLIIRGRPSEAAEFLERTAKLRPPALPATPAGPLDLTLARAYRNMGRTDLAEKIEGPGKAGAPLRASNSAEGGNAGGFYWVDGD